MRRQKARRRADPWKNWTSELGDPISSVWSIFFQQRDHLLEIDGKKDDLEFEPQFSAGVAVALTKNWNLITRPVVTVFNSASLPDPHNSAEIKRTTGFGEAPSSWRRSPRPQGSAGIDCSGSGDLYFSNGLLGLYRAGKVAGWSCRRGWAQPLQEMDRWCLRSESDLLRGFRQSGRTRTKTATSSHSHLISLPGGWGILHILRHHPGKLEGRIRR